MEYHTGFVSQDWVPDSHDLGLVLRIAMASDRGTEENDERDDRDHRVLKRRIGAKGRGYPKLRSWWRILPKNASRVPKFLGFFVVETA